MTRRKTWARLAAAAMLALSGAAAAGVGQAVAQAQILIGPFMVFFEAGSAELDDQARGILDNAAERIRETGGGQQVTLAGHVDDTMSEADAVTASWKMASAVRDYLVAQGVPEGLISVEAFGASRPLVLADKGVAEPQNRRVEITIGTATGW